MLAAQTEAYETSVFVRLLSRGEVVRCLTYGEAWQSANDWAALLLDRGLRRGEPVVLALATSAELIGAFFGTLLAGGVPTLVAPPRRERPDGTYLDQLADRLRRIDGRMLVGPLAHADLDPTSALAGLPELTVVCPDDVQPSTRTLAPDGCADDLALLQFTSGTLGSAKAVELTNKALLAQCDILWNVLALDRRVDSAVSWLPLYHDMGLIGFLLTPASGGGCVTLMPPGDFIMRPRLWMKATSDLGATIIGGPPSAYALCARHIRPEEVGEYDLRQVRVALVGAETISPESLNQFAERFAPAGFQASSLLPTYGLAENSLAVTMTPLGAGPRVDVVAADPLETAGVAEPADERLNGRARRIVSVGPVLPNVEVAIVDRADRRLGDRQVGEILVRGPSLMRGYHGQADESARALRDGWLRTGDLGYTVDRELHVTGRSKEVLIVGGRNYLPDDLEGLAAAVPGVWRGRTVAFSVEDAARSTEAVVLVAESGLTEPDERDALRLGIREALQRSGYPVNRVLLVRPHTIGTTGSGKLLRVACRERYLAGDLGGDE